MSFETLDGGKRKFKHPCNKGIDSSLSPKTTSGSRPRPHRMLICKQNPSAIWQQNHCGIFRTTDAGKEWKLVEWNTWLPHYGFALAISPPNPDEAWVIPAQSDERRIPVDPASAGLSYPMPASTGQHLTWGCRRLQILIWSFGMIF